MDMASLKTVMVLKADFSDELVLQHSGLRSRPSVPKKKPGKRYKLVTQ